MVARRAEIEAGRIGVAGERERLAAAEKMGKKDDGDSGRNGGAAEREKRGSSRSWPEVTEN
ncbi:hypothetical protein AMTR_s00035p00180750 [Amborella trichopoda]|uniref:Uncharacterized protein n=1 Tax=Amborella trichopoda TaxID=13333 RepID=W1PXC7_AMBTC|nr:hypothetical protein AMTR_s00035p00180750 [Amborella trichopoda]